VKIAYAGYLAAYATDGVNDKIRAQISAWKGMGHDVDLYCLSPPPAPGDDAPRVDGSIFTFTSLRERLKATRSLAREIRRRRPDLVYVRYDLFLPPLPLLLSPLPVVLEINTDDRKETRIDGYLGWLYNELTRGASFRAAKGLVCVTSELAGLRSVARFGKPTTVIGNAGDPAAAEPVAAPARRDGTNAVMLVGYMAPWAGVDKLRALCRAFPRLEVHVAGDVGDEDGAEAALPNLHFHGRLERDRYSQILAASDFGIGPLGLHRKGMSEATPLKVRDYLMHGLPVLIAHDDTDFSGPLPWYVLQLPNTERTVEDSLATIETWMAAVAGRRVPRAEVVERIGIEAKEQARIAFFEEIVARPRSRRRWRR